MTAEKDKQNVNTKRGEKVLTKGKKKKGYYGMGEVHVRAVSQQYQGIETPDDLYKALLVLWSAKTCAPRMRERWSKKDPTVGQCSITAFLAQDIFGGDVYGIPLGDGNYHCFNIVGGERFDLTSEQFAPDKLRYEEGVPQQREVHFASEEKKQRYEILREALRKKTALTHIVHPIPPFYDETSRILILGSFPSVKSRESRFFYGHPQNRFWKLMTELYREEKVPETIEEKASVLRRHHIAAWDSIHACDIIGSSDSTIRNVEPNDFSEIFATADIRQVFTNGKKSHEIYTRYCMPRTGREAICLPSTSPANAAWGMDQLIEAWKVILEEP